MGQKSSNLNHNEKQVQRGGSFHISSHANRRREAFKAAKKSHFSFGDEPHRHSIHHHHRQGGDSRRHKHQVINDKTTIIPQRNILQTKAVSTPEKEYRHSSGSLGNIKQNIPLQRSLNTDLIDSNHLNPDYMLGGEYLISRSQSPADSSISRSFYGAATSGSHHSSIKLSEDEDNINNDNDSTQKSPHIKENSTLYLSPAHSPSGYKTINDNRSISPIKRDNNINNNNDGCYKKKTATLPVNNSNNATLESIAESSISSSYKRSIQSCNMSQENLVAALLPPSPLSQKEKRGASLNPHKMLSPYNLSPRSLSPSSQSPINSNNMNKLGYNRNFNEVSSSGSKYSPNIIISSSPTKINIQSATDFSPTDSSLYPPVHKTSAPSATGTSSSGRPQDSMSLLSNIFGVGGDLLSINSKSDTSLSSFSFHKTPSIGLSPTATIRDSATHFLSASENRGPPPPPPPPHRFRCNVNSNTPQNSNPIEKSSSIEGIKSVVVTTPSSNTTDDRKRQGAIKKESKDSDVRASYSPTLMKQQTQPHLPVRPPLNRGTSLLSQVVWPHSIPQELNNHKCSEFQGHQLLSWLCHWCAPHLKSTHKSDLYLVGCQLCTCLLACQQLLPSRRSRISSGSAPVNTSNNTEHGNGSSSRSQSMIFQPEVMYKWNSLKDDLFEDEKKALASGKSCSRCYTLKEELYQKDLEHSYEIQRLKQEQELEIFKVKNEGVMKVCQLNDKVDQLERQVEKYRILAGIEGLARQMWHEEAVAANSNLVMSKSPTLQSISNQNVTKTATSSTKSCSTDTSDLDDNQQAITTPNMDSTISIVVGPSTGVSSSSTGTNESLVTVVAATNTNVVPVERMKSPVFTVTSGVVSNNTISICRNTQSTKEIRDFNITSSRVSGADESDVSTNNRPESRNKIKLQRVSSIADSCSIEDDLNSNFALNRDQTNALLELEGMVESGHISQDLIKLWLELNVSLEKIDIDILKGILDKVKLLNYSQFSNSSSTDAPSDTKSITKNSSTHESEIGKQQHYSDKFWTDIMSVAHLEEKIHFIRRYKDHVELLNNLEICIHQFTYVAHFLQHSESLLHILMLMMESTSSLRTGDTFDLSFSLEKLVQMRQIHTHRDGNKFLDHVIDRYMDTHNIAPTQSTSSNNPIMLTNPSQCDSSHAFYSYPLPEPADIARLTEPSMSLTSLQTKLDRLHDNITSMSHISRCILSCSRHTLVSSDISRYSNKIIQIIQHAECDCSMVREQLRQCDKQYAILQKFFSTNIDSTLFFSLWLDFSNEFKEIWIKKVMQIHRFHGNNTKQTTKPVGAVLPRLINEHNNSK